MIYCYHMGDHFWKLDREEVVVLHLSRPLPMPKDDEDLRALVRTTAWISKRFDIPIAPAYRIVRKLKEEGLLADHEVRLNLNYNRNVKGTGVNVLTPAGFEYAERIKKVIRDV